MRACPLAVCVAALLGCEEKGASPPDRGQMSAAERQFIEGTLADLKAGLAARDEVAVAVNCLPVGNLDGAPALASEFQRLCSVDAPTLLLEKAVASVKEFLAESPSLLDLACMQLFVGDAFNLMAAHPSTDAKLQGLVDEYARLCPAQTAKERAKLGKP